MLKVNLFRVSILLLTTCFSTSCDNPDRDYRKAEQVGTEQSFSDFIRKYPGNPLDEKAKGRIEVLAFESARSKNTAEAYRDYLIRFPLGTCAGQATNMLADLEFAEIERRPNVDVLKEFIERYPKSEKFVQARLLYDKECLNIAIKSNTVEAFERIINEINDSIIREAAKAELIDLEYKATIENFCLESAEKFLKKYPNYAHCNVISEKLAVLMEDNDWAAAEKLDNVISYQEFKKKYTNTKRVCELTVHTPVYISVIPVEKFDTSLPDIELRLGMSRECGLGLYLCADALNGMDVIPITIDEALKYSLLLSAKGHYGEGKYSKNGPVMDDGTDNGRRVVVNMFSLKDGTWVGYPIETPFLIVPGDYMMSGGGARGGYVAGSKLGSVVIPSSQHDEKLDIVVVNTEILNRKFLLRVKSGKYVVVGLLSE